MATARCDLTDLLVDQCACPTHRGEPTPVMPDVETIGAAFEARFPGWCARCEGRTGGGQQIMRAADGGYVHADPGDCR